MFVSDAKKNMPFLIYIISYVDLFFNFFFIININGILIRIFITVYNNWTQKENLTGPITESYCPIHSCCINDEKKLGEKEKISLIMERFCAYFVFLQKIKLYYGQKRLFIHLISEHSQGRTRARHGLH